MAQLTLSSEYEYNAAMQRIEELLPLVEDGVDDVNMWELDLLSELVSEYENAHYHFQFAMA